MAASTPLRVRVRPDTRDRFSRLARAERVTAPELLDRLVTQEEHAQLLRAMNDDFERLRRDQVAWAEFKAETALWDATSGDISGDVNGDG